MLLVSESGTPFFQTIMVEWKGPNRSSCHYFTCGGGSFDEGSWEGHDLSLVLNFQFLLQCRDTPQYIDDSSIELFFLGTSR